MRSSALLCRKKLNLTCYRLVSVPLLQHNMGRRDIFPLRKPRVRRKLFRHIGRCRSTGQSVPCDIFRRHFLIVCPPPLRRPLTRQRLQKSKLHIPPSASNGSATASLQESQTQFTDCMVFVSSRLCGDYDLCAHGPIIEVCDLFGFGLRYPLGCLRMGPLRVHGH